MNKLFYSISFTICLIVIAGCGVKKNDDNTIFFRIQENPVTLDPAKVVDVTGGELAAKLYGGLVCFDKNLNLVPDLAQKYEIDTNNTKIKFFLRSDSKFSNGSSLTSEDVLFSWKRTLDPKTPSPRVWVLSKIKGALSYSEGKSDTITGFTILDSKTFEIELESPFAPFLSLLTMPAASIISRNAEPGAVTSGAYSLKSFDQDNELLLEPNTYHYRFKENTPKICYKIVPEDASAIAMMQTGELDVIKVPRGQAVLLQRQMKDNQFFSTEELNTYFIGLDHRKSFLDLNLKKALFHIIDPGPIIKNILGGQARRAYTPVPPVLQPEKFTDKETYSLEKAKVFFQKSEAAQKELVFMIPSGKETLSVAEILQDQIRRLGAKISLKILDWSAFKEALSNGECDLFLISWWADYADPENFLYPTFYSKNHGSLGNRVYYSDPGMDLLLEQFQKEFDEKTKKETFRSIMKIFYRDLPWIPLWHRTTLYAVSKRIHGFYPVPVYTMDKGFDLSVNPSK